MLHLIFTRSNLCLRFVLCIELLLLVGKVWLVSPETVSLPWTKSLQFISIFIVFCSSRFALVVLTRHHVSLFQDHLNVNISDRNYEVYADATFRFNWHRICSVYVSKYVLLWTSLSGLTLIINKQFVKLSMHHFEQALR